MRKVLFFLLIYIPCWVNGQGFVKYFPQWYYSIEEKNGTYLLAGDYQANPNIMKLDSAGNIIFAKKLPYDAAYIISASNNNYLFYCFRNRSTAKFPQLVRTDHEGNILWTKDIDPYGRFFQDPQKNLIQKSGLGGLIKYDSLGNILWTKSYFNTEIPDIYEIAALPNGDYIFTGRESSTKNYKRIIVRIDGTNGDIIFRKPDPTAGLYNLYFLNDGSLIGGSEDNYILKINQEGDSIWSQKRPDNSTTSIFPVDTFMFAFEFTVGRRILKKCDLNFNTIWSINLSKIDPNIIVYDIAASADGGLMATCSTQTAGPAGIIIKVAPNGKIYTNSIKGTISNDINGNCSKDPDDNGVKGMMVKIDPGNLYSFTDENGDYDISADTGITYKVIPIMNTKMSNLSSDCLPYRTVSFNNKEKDSTNNDFYLKEEICPNPQITYLAGPTPRCFKGTSSIFVSNNGLQDAQDVTLSLSLPPFYFIKKSSRPYSIENNKHKFNIGYMAPGTSIKIFISDSISCSTPLNETSHLIATVSTSTICNLSQFTKDTSITPITVRGSFDPNDIRVFPAKINYQEYTRGTKELRYLIRFQNTGSGVAYSVKVIDTLSSDLEISSIRNIQASHSVESKIINSDPLIIEWIFYNINLPFKSQSDEQSQGFISFTIDLKEGLDDKTTVSNGAAIYFDFNEPVITNRATTLISSEEETETYKESITTNIKSSANHSILLYPNPITESSVIKISPALNSFKTAIYDSKGMKLVEKDGSGDEVSIQRNELKPGIYFYHIYTDSQEIGTGSFLVK